MTQTTTRRPAPTPRPARLAYGTTSSPIGPIAAAWRDDDTLVAVVMAAAERPGRWDTTYADGGPVTRLRAHLDKRFGEVKLARAAPAPVLEALERYFEGDLHAIDALAVDTGGTALQSAIWTHLRTIPAGETMTYGALARAVGRPRATRAAGRAVGTNPIPIVVPCHRIVGTDGTLTGFGGGLVRKRWLLHHEGARREIV